MLKWIGRRDEGVDLPAKGVEGTGLRERRGRNGQDVIEPRRSAFAKTSWLATSHRRGLVDISSSAQPAPVEFVSPRDVTEFVQQLTISFN